MQYKKENAARFCGGVFDGDREKHRPSHFFQCYVENELKLRFRFDALKIAGEFARFASSEN